jgi:hypothetical protein
MASTRCESESTAEAPCNPGAAANYRSLVQVRTALRTNRELAYALPRNPFRTCVAKCAERGSGSSGTGVALGQATEDMMAKSLRRMKNKDRKKKRRGGQPGAGKSKYAMKKAAQRRGNFTEGHRRAFPHAEMVGE